MGGHWAACPCGCEHKFWVPCDARAKGGGRTHAPGWRPNENHERVMRAYLELGVHGPVVTRVTVDQAHAHLNEGCRADFAAWRRGANGAPGAKGNGFWGRHHVENAASDLAGRGAEPPGVYDGRLKMHAPEGRGGGRGWLYEVVLKKQAPQAQATLE